MADQIETEDACPQTTAELAALFTEGYRGYELPVAVDEAGMARHLHRYDIERERSRIVTCDGSPASFALIGRRGRDAWVGGMGTVPAHRREGLGERALRAALAIPDDRDTDTVWLEVLQANRPAVALYEKLGFEVVRELLVWTVAPLGTPASGGDAVADEAAIADANAWIAAHRPDREPWQRADRTLARMLERDPGTLRAWSIARDGEPCAAMVADDHPPAVGVIQAAALDEGAAAQLTRSVAAATGKPLRFVNFAPGDPISSTCSSPQTTQYEMARR